MSSVKVSGSRTLRKGSKKGSKNSSHGSKKGSKRMDFSSILNDMDDMPNNQGNTMMQTMGMPAMSGMQPGMEQMGMPQMGMEQMGMPQMGMPQMGMPQMMMGANPQNIDPLHLQNFVPQHQGLNINNYGVGTEQLVSGSQINRQFSGRQSASAPQMGGGSMFAAYDAFVNKFM